MAFLDARIASGVQPGLDRISGLLELMGSPERDVPMIHIAGTNGKTTAVRLAEDLLVAHDLSVGTFTSPHLERLEERFTLFGRPMDEETLVQTVADVAPFVAAYEAQHATTVTYFEVTAAMAFQAFVTAAVTTAVVEVGLGGRLDATNVVNADVSVITGVSIDHTSYLGETIGEIAGEKAAILKPGGVLVTGPLPAAAEGAVTARVAVTGSTWIRRGSDYDLADVTQAVGGWRATVNGVHASYPDLFLPLHGRHQVDHLATAIVAVETLFERPLNADFVRLAAAAAESPGRIEVAHRNPLVILDGAHNAEGIGGLAEALAAEFPEGHRILVVGFRGERNPVELLQPLRGLVGDIIATEADDATAVPAQAVAAAAQDVFGADVPVEVVTPVAQAVTEALDRAAPDEAVVVTGSLYVVGEARRRLG